MSPIPWVRDLGSVVSAVQERGRVKKVVREGTECTPVRQSYANNSMIGNLIDLDKITEPNKHMLYVF